MAIFDKKPKKEAIERASAPEEPETPGEIKEIERLSDDSKKEEVPAYREVPVCLSQVQINNLVIENNLMLKEIMAQRG